MESSQTLLHVLKREQTNLMKKSQASLRKLWAGAAEPPPGCAARGAPCSAAAASLPHGWQPRPAAPGFKAVQYLLPAVASRVSGFARALGHEGRAVPRVGSFNCRRQRGACEEGAAVGYLFSCG